MPTVAVAGSDLGATFAVIDFTNSPAPPAVLAATKVTKVVPIWTGGTRVALGGNVAAAGSSNSGHVGVWDVTMPATPAPWGTFDTHFGGIGALAVQGELVAAAEWHTGGQVALIDFSAHTSPAPVAIVHTPLLDITSVAFVGPQQVVVSGALSGQGYLVDFGNPGQRPTAFATGFTAASLDADTTRILIGDQLGHQVELVDRSLPPVTLAGPTPTQLGGVASVAMAFPFGLLGSTLDPRVVRVSISGPTITVTPFTPVSGGGFATAIAGRFGACGTMNAQKVALVDLSLPAPATIGLADTGFSAVDTVGVSTFPGPPIFVDLSWIWAWIWAHLRIRKV
jgi:hypothetical protein